jgi:hypothetical protein
MCDDELVSALEDRLAAHVSASSDKLRREQTRLVAVNVARARSAAAQAEHDRQVARDERRYGHQLTIPKFR